MAEKYLEINHIKKAFGDLEVLKDISMSVEAGKVTAIIGPSGSGKSTLLRCATMLETMDDGELIYLGEHAVRSQNGRAVYARQEQLKKIKQYYGLVFQNFNLFPHYSVLKNIMDAPVRVQRRNREEVKKQALELLDKMGLSDKAQAYPCPAFRRAAAAGIHRQSAGHESQDSLFRRAHLRSGSGAYGRDPEGHPGTGGGAYDHGHCDP